MRHGGGSRRRRRHGGALCGALLLALTLAAPAGATSINTLNSAYGSGGNASTGIGPGSYSPEMTRGVGGITYYGGVDATGAALAALDGLGEPSNVFPGGRLELAPAAAGPSVPVFHTWFTNAPAWASGRRELAAAAWADQTAGVMHVRIVDATRPGEPEGAFADQTIDIPFGGNAPPVPVAARFTGNGTLLVAAQVVQASGGVTSRAWAVARVDPGTYHPVVPGTATLDPTWAGDGILQGPFTSGGGALRAMELRGNRGAVLTGIGDFTGADSVPNRLHVLALDDFGHPHGTFGTTGLATVDATGDPDAPTFGIPPAPQTGVDLVVGATGDITVAGGQGPTGPAFLVRLSPSGNQRQSFGTGGHVVYDPPGTYQTARFDEVAIYPDGSSYALADIVVSALGAVLVHVGPTGDVLSETVFAEGDTLACTQEPRAMHLASQTGGDSIIVAGECTGLNAVEFTDEHLVRRVLAQAVPREIDAGGRSVALGEAARPDPDSAAQDEVGSTIAATPLRGSPLRGSPLRGSPLRGSPLRGSPLRGSPLRGSPLRGSPLTETPLRGSGGWRAALQSTPLRGSPLQTITLGDVLDLGDAATNVSLGDLDPTRGILRRTSVASLLLLGRPLDALPPPASGVTWCQYLQGLGPAPRCGAGGVDSAETHTLDLELLGADLRSYWHGVPIALTDEVMGSGDLRAPLGEIPLQAVDLAATPLGKIRQEQVNDAIGCSADCHVTLADKQEADPTSFADVVLGDLLASARAPAGVNQLYTLQELLPGIAPASELSPEEAAALDALIHRSTTNGNRLALGGSFVARCDQIGGSPGIEGLTIVMDAPGIGYVPGSGTIQVGSQRPLDDPVVAGDTLTFTRMREGGTSVPLSEVCDGFGPTTPIFGSVSFDGETPTGLGPHEITTTVIPEVGAPVTSQAATYDVVDDSDPPGNASTTAVLAPDTLYTGYIPAASDVDSYRIPAPPAGSVVTVSLSNLPADEDLFVQGPKAGIPVPPSRRRARSAAVSADAPLPDQSVDLNGDEGTASADAASGMPMSAASLAALPLRGVSNRTETKDESVSFLVQRGDAGSDFLATVAAADGDISNEPYAIRVTVTPPADEPDCMAPRTGLGSGALGTFPTDIPTTTQTLILWNRQRTEAAYPGSGATLADKLATLATADGVSGAVIPVEADPTHGASVRSALQAWDAGPCDPGAANDVVSAIGEVVDRLRPQLPALRHVVLVGGDDLLPQGRVPDLVGIANEREQADAMTAGGDDTPLSRALRRGLVLSDDPYGDFDPQAWLTGTLALPDVGLGRLVETPAEIGAQIDRYVTAGGVLPVDSARVTGYDFITDGAGAIGAAMQSMLGAANVGTRIDETWTANDALNFINRAGGGITSVNAHYDHYRALPAAPGADLLQAADASPAPGSLLFTIGCHAGLSSIDAYGVAGDPGLGDWAAQLTKGGSVFAGNTGYGYGDTGSIAYSERLLAIFAEQLAARASTAGQALMFAKQRYFATLGVPGVYDGKALQEMTFYGLPMYRVSASGELGAPALPPADPSGATTVLREQFDVQPEFSQVTTDRGRYWTADGRDPIATHFRPIQPRTDLDVTPTDGAVVHGALITALQSSDVPNVDPVLSRPTVDLAANEPEVGPEDVAFPATLQRVQEFAAADGRHVGLNLAAGQYLGDTADPQGRGTQRLFSRIAGDVLRSRSADFDPPRIARVDVAVANGRVAFDVATPDTDVTGGLALYQDAAGVWRSAELTISGGHARGSGPLPGDAEAAGVAFIQLVDAAGNVGLAADKGRGYGLSPAADTGANAPPLVTDPPPDADGAYAPPVSVRISGAARSTATISVDGSAYEPYEGPIVLETSGVHVIAARAPDGSTSRLEIIIEPPDVDDPTITITTPAGGATYARGQNVEADYTCADEAGGSGVASCVGTVADGAAIDTGTLGAKTFSVTATDNAGNDQTVSVSYTVADRTDPTATITAPADGAQIPRNASVLADYACADEAGGSGLDSCVGTVADGAAINTATLGAKTFSVTAIDEAGNDRTVSVGYTVTDETDPTVTIARPVEGATYARGSSVLAEYACADEAGGSGLDSCVGTVADGAAIDTATLGAKTFSVTAADEAGNDRTVSVGYTVTDETDPTVTIARPVEGATYARGSSVLAEYACADEAGGSGLDSCVGTVADGAAINTATLGAKTFSVTATDEAGNDRTVSVGYTVTDQTDPTVTIARPVEGATYARGSSVLAEYACADEAGGSGLDSCVGTVADGAAINTATLGAKTFSVTATDEAGNDRTVSVGYTVTDETDPTVTIARPVEGATYARGSSVLAEYACADEAGGSGLDSCVGTVADGAAINTATLGAKTFSVTAIDEAGNDRTVSVGYTVTDQTDPTVTIARPVEGATYARGSSVLAEYACADEAGGSGLDSCVGTVADGAAINTATLGAKTFSVTATDKAGNDRTVSVQYTVVDVTDPVIGITSPTEGQAIPRDTVVAAQYACTDEAGGSGVATCVGTVADGQPVDTATLGAKTFSVTATDNAGNTDTKTVGYTVIDVTDPVIAIASPTEGQAIARNTVVAAQYACTDEAGGSGVATCVGTVAGGQPVDTATLGAKTFSVTATDNAGNTDTKTVGYTVVDVTVPTINAVTPGAGTTYEQGATILADYSCADEPGGSGLASCAGTKPNGQPIDTSGGTHLFTIDAADNAGNLASTTINYIARDRIAPQISIGSPMGSYGLVWILLNPPRAHFACTDNIGGTGMASCTATADGKHVSNNAIVPTGLGRHTFKVTATDQAGNVSTKTTSYTVTLL